MNLEDIQIRAYEDGSVFLDYSLNNLINEARSNLAYVENLAEAIAKLPLPSRLSFDKKGLNFSFRVPLSEDGFVCDLKWLKEQIELIIKYADALMRAP